MTDPVKQIEHLVDNAVLGQQVDSFMRSDIGKYLLEKARTEQAEGYSELLQADFTDCEAVRKAQNKVHRAEDFVNWLNEAIITGLRATEVLESREEG